MRSDVNYSHSKNIGEAVGSFCELPIRSYDNFALELDVALGAQNTILRNRAMGCSDIPNTAEILPGEVLCADNIVRRVTTAEAIGYDTFKERRPVKFMVGTLGVYVEGQWTYEKKAVGASKPRQSTPEELTAYLNGEDEVPGFYDKLSQHGGLHSEVTVEEDDKIIKAKNKTGALVFSFRYITGTPSTYIGGDEARLLDPPQTTVGLNSPSHVIQCFIEETAPEPHLLGVLGNKGFSDAIPEEVGEIVPPLDWEKEEWRKATYVGEPNWRWVNSYAPTSHVERITVGGTALFAPEEPV